MAYATAKETGEKKTNILNRVCMFVFMCVRHQTLSSFSPKENSTRKRSNLHLEQILRAGRTVLHGPRRWDAIPARKKLLFSRLFDAPAKNPSSFAFRCLFAFSSLMKKEKRFSRNAIKRKDKGKRREAEKRQTCIFGSSCDACTDNISINLNLRL